MSILELNPTGHHSMKGLWSESHHCTDCGYNTAPGMPPRVLAEEIINRDGEFDLTFTEECEIYMVKDKIWQSTGLAPYGGVLCVGCLEKRIGRKLKRKDFVRGHPLNNPGMPCTDRLL